MGRLRFQLIAKRLNISQGSLIDILGGLEDPPYRLAKKLATIMGTSPLLWTNGTPAQRQAAFNRFKKLNGE